MKPLKKTTFQTWVWRPEPKVEYHFKWAHPNDIDKHNPCNYIASIDQGMVPQLEFLMHRQFMLEAGFFPIYAHFSIIENPILKENPLIDQKWLTDKIEINKLP